MHEGGCGNQDICIPDYGSMSSQVRINVRRLHNDLISDRQYLMLSAKPLEYN